MHLAADCVFSVFFNDAIEFSMNKAD